MVQVIDVNEEEETSVRSSMKKDKAVAQSIAWKRLREGHQLLEKAKRTKHISTAESVYMHDE